MNDRYDIQVKIQKISIFQPKNLIKFKKEEIYLIMSTFSLVSFRNLELNVSIKKDLSLQLFTVCRTVVVLPDPATASTITFFPFLILSTIFYYSSEGGTSIFESYNNLKIYLILNKYMQ